MLYYDRIDVSRYIDVNKTSASKACIICHYWYFLYNGFTFQLSVCNGCYDVLKILIDLNSTVILNVHGVDYRRIISGINEY